MEDRSTFEDLVLKHLNDPENQDLLHEVSRMRALSAAHERDFQDIKKLWDLAPQVGRLQEVDELRSLKNLEAALGRRASGKSRTMYFWSSIAASLFFSVFALWSYFSQTRLTYLVKETQTGVIDSVRLADGSQIFLAGNTALRYPEKFTGDTRPVALLKGKAFFKIAKDPKHAFEVTIDKSVVKVLGTSFNINYVVNRIDLSVKTGRVMFSANSKSDPAILTAGDALSYDLDKNQLTKENGLNSTGWLTRELHFVDMPLEEVCRQLSDYYQVKVVLQARTSTAKKLNANFSNTSIEDVLKVLKQTYPIQIHKKDSIIYIKNL
ncbi:FecR family protein [Pedobacter nyackensis]|uniref:FecR family protein n=1 Tax=Pedobacter nyackensis TaxID=475255 RepID=UPI00292D4F98|nr:FecR domain-containing protein [Pedobacter nyackensis]